VTRRKRTGKSLAAALVGTGDIRSVCRHGRPQDCCCGTGTGLSHLDTEDSQCGGEALGSDTLKESQQGCRAVYWGHLSQWPGKIENGINLCFWR
jgi:hypothetical protein